MGWVLGLSLLCGCGRGMESAQPDAAEAETTPTPAPAYTELAPPLDGCEAMELQIDGEACDYVYRKDGKLYLDPMTILRHWDGQRPQLRQEEGLTEIRAADLNLTLRENDGYLQANGRYLYLPDAYLRTEGRCFLPADVIGKLFRLYPTAGEAGTVKLSMESREMIQGGEDYYEFNFNGDDFYWLCHIIQAEADNQNLACMIGVGNVVLNRTRAEGFPDTVFKVVFDYQNAPQFTPRMSTALSRMVTEDVRIAACLCLEGYNTVGDCLYFQNPLGVETNWTTYTRQYAMTIDDMDFYY